MRNRIAHITLGGEQRRLFRHEKFPGYFLSAVYVTSETPQHAEFSIRKINSHKWGLLHEKPKVKRAKDRKKLYGLLSRTQYRAAIGL